VDLAAGRIATALTFRTTPISTKELRHVAGLVGANGVPTRLYSRALERALEWRPGWTKVGRMLVPKAAHVAGAATHAGPEETAVEA
jgi:hypothetical protein